MPLPAEAPGHWSTEEGREKLEEYTSKTRTDLYKGDMSDAQIANAVFMASRHELDLIHWQDAAKHRIRWLSAQLAVAHARIKELEK